MTIRQDGSAACSSAAASRPSPPGIWTSSNATSTRCAVAAATTSAPDLGHDLDVGLQPEHRRQRPAHQRLVVGQQHPDHPRPPPGVSRVTPQTLNVRNVTPLTQRGTTPVTRGPPSARAGTPPEG